MLSTASLILRCVRAEEALSIHVENRRVYHEESHSAVDFSV